MENVEVEKNKSDKRYFGLCELHDQCELYNVHFHQCAQNRRLFYINGSEYPFCYKPLRGEFKNI